MCCSESSGSVCCTTGLAYYLNTARTSLENQRNETVAAFERLRKTTDELILLGMVHGNGQLNNYIIVGATMGTLMAANVWMIIWPAQKIALGIVEGGDKAAAGAKALLASRTNTLFSAPMLFGMLAGPHVATNGYGTAIGGTGLTVMLVIILALQVNALKGKQGPMTTVKGVIGSSLALTAVMVAVLNVL